MAIDQEREDKWQRPPWICAADGYTNQGVRDRCRHCNRPRPGHLYAQLTASADRLEQTWKADRSAMLPLVELSSHTSCALIEHLDAWRDLPHHDHLAVVLRRTTLDAIHVVLPGLRALIPELLEDLSEILGPGAYRTVDPSPPARPAPPPRPTEPGPGDWTCALCHAPVHEHDHHWCPPLAKFWGHDERGRPLTPTGDPPCP
jgi:hypothetical protein